MGMSLIFSGKDWFKLDGTLCDEMGLMCDTPQIPPMAKKRYTKFKYGSDEDGVFSDDSYEDVPYTLVAYKFPMSRSVDFYDTPLYAWIQSAKILEISRYADYYFKIRTIDSIQPVTRSDGMRIDYKINMTLSPFRYLTHNEEFALPQDGIVANPGTRYSKPVIRFTANGGGVITTNGEELTIANESGLITVDSNRMLIYKTVGEQNTSIMEKTVGKLPMFGAGDNAVQVSSSISGITITGNWRCY